MIIYGDNGYSPFGGVYKGASNSKSPNIRVKSVKRTTRSYKAKKVKKSKKKPRKSKKLSIKNTTFLKSLGLKLKR